MFVETRDWSNVFWGAMLPICWVLSPILAMLAQVRVQSAGTMEDRPFQNTLFMAVFLAAFGLMAMRILIGRAIDEHRTYQVCLLAVLSLLASGMLIAYGVASMYFFS